MMVMTAKVDMKKIAVILAAIVGIILTIVLLFGGSNDAEETAATVSGNDSRVQFLKGFGWEVTQTPTQSGQVKIPDSQSEVFDRYNALQKSQGYDLSQHAGKTVMRYVYQINNYPGATEPVYATLLVDKNQIIGGDITSTAPEGVVHGFKMPQGASVPETTGPAAKNPETVAPGST